MLRPLYRPTTNYGHFVRDGFIWEKTDAASRSKSICGVTAMGYQVNATCRTCGAEFTVDHGGGFSFHLLRCDRCGKTKATGFNELGEVHVRYVKGLPGPYCVASAERDRAIQKNARIASITEKEYRKKIDAMAGACTCGGRFRLDAPPRCPKCRSRQIDEGETAVMYD